MSEWSELLSGLRECVFPPVCVHCGELVESESPLRALCTRCAGDVYVVGRPACERCGFPFFGPVHGRRSCPHCVGLNLAYREGRTMVLFRGPARSLMLELKYHRGLQVLQDMACLAGKIPDLESWLRGGVLVPVPMHPRKKRERGYNQTELIAKKLSKVFPGEFTIEHLLRRVEDSPSQTGFDRAARLTNLKYAFAMASGVKLRKEQRYILLDDVFTTGSTLNRCASVLRKAGADAIDVLSFGHG